MNGTTRPIGVDLFAGAGGMSLGFEQAGFDVLAAVELDPIHCATHEFNFPFWSVLCQSVADTTADAIRNLSAIGNREIDVVFGGPPCQGFSLIGKRALDDPRNSLVFHFLRLVLDLKPKYFVMENVRGLTLGKHQKLLEEIIEEFQLKDYEVEENYKVLNAAHYGVPQNRERLFLLGCQKGLTLPQYPEAITCPATLSGKNSSKLSMLTSCPTVWDAIGDLPEVEDYPELLSKDWVIAEYGKPSQYSGQLRNFYPVDDDYSYRRQFNSQLLTSSLGTQHTLESIKRFAGTVAGKIEPISRFHKLNPQGICNTLRAGTASNRGAFTSPRPIHPFTPRCITVREAARLHSYPDWFRFHVTKWHGCRQVGNSVPPLLAKAVASEIIRVLNVPLQKPAENWQMGEEKLLELNMSQAAKRYGVNSQVIEPRTRSKR
ncbi:DNA cytosine methyltransferase [Microcoleus sp. FACHB-68]|uniref:DNA cytosine methyltransferase n=1 Tax=Microcoleus sp. FACHB-68 TaxID=2692826 RepID=UPI0016828816|nr:DNA cytosine methyltransferase [Microcoleus sp. FACHB-68]MBD1936955.1 DNA cytosine methyltransferase [Microcoleus sp. FACHB-68]